MKIVNRFMNMSTFDFIRVGSCVALGWYIGRAAFQGICVVAEAVLDWMVRHV